MFGRRPRRGSRRLIGILAGAVFVMAGCGSNTGENIEGNNFEDDQTDLPPLGGGSVDASVLLVGTTDKIADLDPLGGAAVGTGPPSLAADVLANATDRLVEVGAGAERFVPGLATSWTTSPDGRIYTFTLRRGVTFHDGGAFEADDVVASVERLVDHGVGSDQGDLGEHVVSVEASGEHEVMVTMADPDLGLLETLARPEASILPAGADGDTAIVGTGPYEVTEFHPRAFLTLRLFDGYWGDAPAIDTVRITAFDTSVHLRDALANDEVDVVFDPLYPSQVEAVEAAGVNVARHGDDEAYYRDRVEGVDQALAAGRPIWFPGINLSA